ncbi:MAG: low molecular weight phosphatase family protein [Gammaproteobacteria bacterium]
MKKVLFICTGNYYRSRFAEEYFNHHARLTGLAWISDSAGIRAIEHKPDNPGPISPLALSSIERHAIEPLAANREPRQLSAEDVQSAHLNIALCRREHQPMFEAKFPELRDQMRYWDVEDIGLEDPETALGRIAVQVDTLIQGLQGGRPYPG